MKKFIICFQDVFYYTSWFNINAKSLNELIYFSTCRREVFNTDTAAKEKISEIKELADSLTNKSLSNSFLTITNQLIVKEFKWKMIKKKSSHTMNILIH